MASITPLEPLFAVYLPQVQKDDLDDSSSTTSTIEEVVGKALSKSENPFDYNVMERKFITCPKCSNNVRMNNIRGHLLKVHHLPKDKLKQILEEVKKIFDCFFCHERFSTPKQLVLHAVNYHFSNEEVYIHHGFRVVKPLVQLRYPCMMNGCKSDLKDIIILKKHLSATHCRTVNEINELIQEVKPIQILNPLRKKDFTLEAITPKRRREEDERSLKRVASKI